MNARPRDVATWLASGPETAPGGLLLAVTERTRTTRQVPAAVALLSGAPLVLGRDTASPTGRRTLLLVVAGLVALLIGAWVIGSTGHKSLLVLQPTLAPATSTSATAAPTILASLPPRPGSVFAAPGSGALFAADLPQQWRVSRDDEGASDARRITVEFGLVNFDPVAVAWIDVAATVDALDEVRASMEEQGWSTAEPITAPGLDGVLLTGAQGSGLDPTAIVAASTVTYRVTSHHETNPVAAKAYLNQFLGVFTPLGMADPTNELRDPAWGFVLSYDAAGRAFLPGASVGDGVTRFAASDCPAGTEPTCARYIEIVRRANVSPLHLTMPDGRAVRLRIDPTSDEYVQLAADWESRVGTSRGSAAFVWQGTIIYDVDNTTFGARFIHRDGQWLIVLASGADLPTFLAGLTLTSVVP